MFNFVWSLAAALAGLVAGKVNADDGLGPVADTLLGLTGAFAVRWSFEKLDVPLDVVYLLLFSIWGAAACPTAIRFVIRRRPSRSKVQTESREAD